MKIKYNKIFVLGLSLVATLAFTSCDTDQEPITGNSTLSPSSPSISISKNFTGINGVEKDATYTIGITLSEEQVVDITLNLFQSGGNATEGEDFTLSTHQVIIPAYTTYAEASLSIVEDTVIEGTETLSITIGDNANANTTFTSETWDFTLTNYVGDDLTGTFSWAQDVTLGANTYSTSNNVDLDVFVSDAAGFDVNDPWATFNGTGYAATGNEPEVLTMSMQDWADGEYVLWHEVWTNAFRSSATGLLNPITAHLVRPGALDITIVQDDSQAAGLDIPGVDDGGSAGSDTHGFIAKIVIDNGTYTIFDYNNVNLGSGKFTNGKRTARPQLILNK